MAHLKRKFPRQRRDKRRTHNKAVATNTAKTQRMEMHFVI